ncbi:MAG TPA: ABC transporter permease [Candidatus Binatia bacterium]|nr:ABC transporter permease [Candidatus Binatia bacterium]
MSRRWDPLWFGLAVLSIWQLLHLRVGSEGLASPAQTLHRIETLFGSSNFWSNVASTGQAFALSILIAVVVGTTIGLVLGLFHEAGDVFDPILNALSSLPKITLYPIILLFFGLGMPARVAFGTIHAIFPLMILTMNGVRTIRPVVRKTARSLRLSPVQTIRTVLLPAALPEIFTGLRLGVALALLGVLVGEMFASDRGIGFMLMQGVERQDSATIMGLTVLLFTIAVSGGVALLAIDKRLHG